MDLVLVDGPNLFNAVARSLALVFPTGSAAHGDYLKHWFDVDRFVMATIAGKSAEWPDEPNLGIIIFRSMKSLGKDTCRIATGADVEAFWGRQARQPYTSEILVQIPGNETQEYKCDNCGSTVATEKREKGVDASMICHLFETADRWENVCLFTGDADFVPAVHALRRRGKCVFAAADDASSADSLVRAVQSCLSWPVQFLTQDRQWFEAVRPGGELDDLVDRVTAIDGAILIGHAKGWFVSAVASDGQSLRALVSAATTKLGEICSARQAALKNGVTEISFTMYEPTQHVRVGMRRHLAQFESSARWSKHLKTE